MTTVPSSIISPFPTSTLAARRRYRLLVLVTATGSNATGALDALNSRVFFLNLDLGLSLRLVLLTSGPRLGTLLARRLRLLRSALGLLARTALVDATGRIGRNRGSVDLGALENVPTGTKRLT